jgi:hypothetical protein
MKKIVLLILSLGLIYIFSSDFFINIVPPTKKELSGDYKSEYNNRKYNLSILANGESKFTVKKDNLITYEDNCKSLEIEKVGYRALPAYNVSFRKCDKMDSYAILKRDMFFNLIIGNNGSELKRIDPDANVFYQK